MTPAAQTMALRLGVAAGNSSTPREPKKTSKYMTPKQKKELAAREQNERARAEKEKANAQKEARLQQEVQELFDKMNDKSTSWADFEDE